MGIGCREWILWKGKKGDNVPALLTPRSMDDRCGGGSGGGGLTLLLLLWPLKGCAYGMTPSPKMAGERQIVRVSLCGACDSNRALYEGQTLSSQGEAG